MKLAFLLTIYVSGSGFRTQDSSLFQMFGTHLTRTLKKKKCMMFLCLCSFGLLCQGFLFLFCYGCTVNCLHNFSAFVLLVLVQLLILNRTAASEIHWRDGPLQCACLPLALSWTGSITAQEACVCLPAAFVLHAHHASSSTQAIIS